MMRLMMVMTALLWAGSAGAQTDADARYAELIDWVYYPCMQIATAVDVEDLTDEHFQMGINREQVSTMMLASREAAIRNLAEKMSDGATWKERSAAYRLMLDICMGQFYSAKE